MSAELITTKQFVNTNLKAYYRFESGALTTDSSGEGHTLTAISDPAEDASGKFGGAVALDGNDAYSATDHADFKPTGNFTVGCWIKTSAGSAIPFGSMRYDGTTYSGIRLYIDANGIFYLQSFRNTGKVAGTDYQNAAGTTDVRTGAWVFLVGTWDGSYLRVYVNGTLDNTAVAWANAPGYNATNYVRIGARKQSASAEDLFVNGSLDDVFLLNGTALTADQIKGIYDGKTNFKLNIGDDWKDADYAYINIGDAWKPVTEAKINIGDTWKSIF
jgi:hypothetical protein